MEMKFSYTQHATVTRRAAWTCSATCTATVRAARASRASGVTAVRRTSTTSRPGVSVCRLHRMLLCWDNQWFGVEMPFTYKN